MPESRPPPRLSLRFAAIGGLAGLMVLLPLGEVLRYQTDEVQLLMAERALLDPLAHAVATQRSLIGHAEVAARVLAGRRQLEVERRLRQAEVDGAIFELKGTLAAGLWDRALAEADDLALDWRQLVGRIQLGKVEVAACQAAHRLLVEQALQVMDLVTADARAGSAVALASTARPAAADAQADADPQRKATLERAQAALTARSLQLDGQLARLHGARNQQIGAIALLGTALAATLAWALRRQPHPERPPPGRSDSGQRRGHGRRSTDGVPASDTARGLIEQWRQAEPDAARTAAPSTLPPRR